MPFKPNCKNCYSIGPQMFVCKAGRSVHTFTALLQRTASARRSWQRVAAEHRREQACNSSVETWQRCPRGSMQWSGQACHWQTAGTSKGCSIHCDCSRTPTGAVLSPCLLTTGLKHAYVSLHASYRQALLPSRQALAPGAVTVMIDMLCVSVKTVDKCPLTNRHLLL